MLKEVLTITLVLLFLPSIALASNIVSTCLDVNTSQTNVTMYNSTGDLIVDLSWNETCQFGCVNQTGECEGDVNLSDVGIIIALPLIALGLTYFASQHGKEHSILQMFVLSMSLFLMVLNVSILIRLAEYSGQGSVTTMLGGGYWVMIVTMVFVVFYYILYVLTTVIKGMLKRKKG